MARHRNISAVPNGKAKLNALVTGRSEAHMRQSLALAGAATKRPSRDKYAGKRTAIRDQEK